MVTAKMQLQLQLTPEDRREAFKAVQLTANVWAPIGRVRKLLGVMGFTICLALIGFMLSRPLPIVGTSFANIKLWLLYLPAAIVPVFLIWQYVGALAFPINTEKKRVRTFKQLKPRERLPRWRLWLNRLFMVWCVAASLVLLTQMNQDSAANAVDRGDSSVWVYPGTLITYHLTLWTVVLGAGLWLDRRTRRLGFEKWLAQNAGWQRVTCEFSDERIEFVREQARFNYSWSAARRFVETENLYVLTFGFEIIEIVPKRSFTPWEDSMKFLALLTRKIGNGLIIEKTARGFPVLFPTSNTGDFSEKLQ